MSTPSTSTAGGKCVNRNAAVGLTVLTMCSVSAVYGVLRSVNLNISLSPTIIPNTLQQLGVANETVHPNVNRVDQLFLDPGWDESAQTIYANTMKANMAAISGKPGGVELITMEPGLTVRVLKRDTWWQSVNNKFPKQWEHDTLEQFYMNIDSDTIVIDFGTWIGPTVLHAAPRAAAVYGIEADPSAYAFVTTNVKLNSDKQWYNRIKLLPSCVGTDDGFLATMRTGLPGNSASGMGRKTAAGDKYQWKVRCYTLDYLMRNWMGIDLATLTSHKVFIKVDVESYECTLVPTWTSWLAKLPPLRGPTFHISYHPHVSRCTRDEYSSLEKFAALYAFRHTRHNTAMSTVQEVSKAAAGDAETADLLLSNYKMVLG